jgi:hypothetical protein
MADKRHYQKSTLREKIVENVFVGETYERYGRRTLLTLNCCDPNSMRLAMTSRWNAGMSRGMYN